MIYKDYICSLYDNTWKELLSGLDSVNIFDEDYLIRDED
jgi:hypothetical protein